MNTLLILGVGYSAQYLLPLLAPNGWRVIGTTRSAEKAAALSAKFGISMLLDNADIQAFLPEVTHILATAGPGEHGDPFLPIIQSHRHALKSLKWTGYLSTIGVYAEKDGGWVDETSPTHAETVRIRERMSAEAGWHSLCDHTAIFRLGGIYGPYRSPFDALRAGTAQRIIKPGHVFNRIHVQDIAGVLHAALHKPEQTGIFNLVDFAPASNSDVLEFAATLLDMPTPPEIAFEIAKLSPMAQEFYNHNKRVSNRRIIDELAYKFQFPSYREGLISIANLKQFR